MKKIIIFLTVLLITMLFTSCSTQQRIVYRDCNCNTPTFGLGWNFNPYWGWNNNPYWNRYSYRVIPRYYIQPNRIQPTPPTRYERKQSVGPRFNRNQPFIYEKRTPSSKSPRSNQPSRIDNVYPQRSQPSRTQTPSRIQQRTTPPTNNQPTRSRSNNN